MIEPRPLIADVDDWELGFFHHKRLLRKLSSALDVLDPAAPLHTARSERLLRHADAIMVSNRFLQARYGGTIVRHCRDTQVLDPRKWDPSELRSQLGWRDEKVVMFLGTPRAHKGLEILLEAMRHVQNPAVHLAIVGASASDRLRLRSSAPNVSVLGEIAMADVPRYVAAADAFVVPQSASAASWGQLPAKVFDAMAMGKPLIATEVSDIPEVVGDSGYLVAPDDPRALARAIDLVFADPALAARKGTLARQRCVELFDRGVMAKQIADVIESARDQFRR
jgi:glycosyltransferase involved in cell wall biosynthesis